MPTGRWHRRRDGAPASGNRRAVTGYWRYLDDATFGAATEELPKFVSSGSGGTLHRCPWRSAFFAYPTNYLIDVDNAVIVDVEATTAVRQAEVRPPNV